MGGFMFGGLMLLMGLLGGFMGMMLGKWFYIYFIYKKKLEI